MQTSFEVSYCILFCENIWFYLILSPFAHFCLHWAFEFPLIFQLLGNWVKIILLFFKRGHGQQLTIIFPWIYLDWKIKDNFFTLTFSRVKISRLKIKACKSFTNFKNQIGFQHQNLQIYYHYLKKKKVEWSQSSI